MIEKIIELVLYSGHIKHEKAVSLILIAPPEAGKSSLLKKFRRNDGIAYVTDATAFGLTRDYLENIKDGLVKHIIIPDLLVPMSKAPHTRESFITFMNGLIEEGIAAASTYEVKIKFEKDSTPINCGLMTSITEDVFNDKRRGWNKLGFISRTLPVSYNYSKEFLMALLDNYVIKQKYKKEDYISLKFPSSQVDVKMDEKYAKEMVDKTKIVAEGMKIYGIRLAREFIVLTKASALSNGREEVIQEDVDLLKYLLYFINLDFNPIMI